MTHVELLDAKMALNLRAMSIVVCVCSIFFVVSCTAGKPEIPIEISPVSLEKIVTVEVTRVIEVVRTEIIPVTVVVTPTTDPQATSTSVSDIPQATTGLDYDYSGTYAMRWGADLAEDGGCILKVIHHQQFDPFDYLEFELFCIRGAPSYNSGHVQGSILFENRVSKMAAFSSSYGACELVFKFQNDIVNTIQIGHSGDCGFGGGVLATGQYKIEDATIPVLGCMALDDPCRN